MYAIFTNFINVRVFCKQYCIFYIGDGNMAQIDLDNIRQVEKQRNTIHDKVYTTYTSFEMRGLKYIQIDTYGKIDRENPEKISQSIQLDYDTSKFLVNLLTHEFNLK